MSASMSIAIMMFPVAEDIGWSRQVLEFIKAAAQNLDCMYDWGRGKQEHRHCLAGAVQ